MVGDLAAKLHGSRNGGVERVERSPRADVTRQPADSLRVAVNLCDRDQQTVRVEVEPSAGVDPRLGVRIARVHAR